MSISHRNKTFLNPKHTRSHQKNDLLGRKLPPIDSITGDNLICMDSSSMSVSSGSKCGATDEVEDDAKLLHRINRKKQRNLANRKKNKKRNTSRNKTNQLAKRNVKHQITAQALQAVQEQNFNL